MKHNSIRQMWQALRVFMLLFACCVSSIAWGQGTNSVKGHITDGNGEPLIGVSILVKNTNNGTVSDLDGNFTLSSVPSSAKTLQTGNSCSFGQNNANRS